MFIHDFSHAIDLTSNAQFVKFILLTQVDGKKPRNLHINRFWNNKLAKQTEYLKPSFNHSATSLEGELQNSLMFLFLLIRVERKLVFRFSDQVKHKPARTAMEAG